jgi:hypothetical protein
VSISISCRELPHSIRAGVSGVDCVAAAFVQDPRTQAFVLAGQTEWLANEPNPDFVRFVRFDHHRGQGQIVKFSIYDVSSAAAATAAITASSQGHGPREECIGSVLVRLDDVVSAERELMYALLHEEPSKAARLNNSIIILTHEREHDDDDEEEDGPGGQQQQQQQGPPPTAITAFGSSTPARGAVSGGMLGPVDMSSDDDDEEATPVPQHRKPGGGGPGALGAARLGGGGGGRPAPLPKSSAANMSDSDFTISLGSPGSLTSLSPDAAAQPAAAKRR